MKEELIKMAHQGTKQLFQGISNKNLIKYSHKNHVFLSRKNRFLIGYFISLYKFTICKFSVQLKIYLYFAAEQANVPTQEKKQKHMQFVAFSVLLTPLRGCLHFSFFWK